MVGLDPVTRRIIQLLLGLVLYGLADSLMIRAAIGVDPWTVFAQGISYRTGVGIGWVTNVVGVFVLLLWIPLRQKPGIGTVVNIIVIGPAIEFGLRLIPPASGIWAQVLYFAAGLLMVAIGSGLYIGARFGPGPRDGLMTGIHRRMGWPIWVGRTMVEATVLLVGWLLGGNVGLGTLAFALLIGPLCGWTLPLFATPVRVKDAAIEARLEGDVSPSAPSIDSPAN
jgi:uncharacterized membrane protein YczE